MRSDAAASPRLGGATPSTSAPTAYQITLTHHQKSVKVPLYRIFPVERHFHWVSVTPGGNLERDMATGGAREVSGLAASAFRRGEVRLDRAVATADRRDWYRCWTWSPHRR